MKYLKIGLIVFASLALVVAAVVARELIAPLYKKTNEFQRLVAVSWGDGKYGKAYYGAYVFYEPQDDGTLRVMLRVEIGRGSTWFQYASEDLPIGTARDPVEAVDKWGFISWSDAGITVGRPGYAYLYPRTEMENHR